MTDLITDNIVMSHRPCERYHKVRVRELFTDPLTPLQVTDSNLLPGVPNKDRVWLLSRPNICSDRVNRLVACRTAFRTLSLAKDEDPNQLLENIVTVAQRFAVGLASRGEMKNAFIAACYCTPETDCSAVCFAAAYDDANEAAYFAADYSIDCAPDPGTERRTQIADYAELIKESEKWAS